jgi:hypothetical protein
MDIMKQKQYDGTGTSMTKEYFYYGLLSFHVFFATSSMVSVEYGIQEYKVEKQRKQIQSRIQDFQKDMTMPIRCLYSNRKMVQLELIPYLLLIICVPVQLHVHGAPDPRLERLIEVMYCFGLQLEKQQKEHGTMEYSFLLETMTEYPFYKSKRGFKDMGYKVCSMIQHELETRRQVGGVQNPMNTKVGNQTMGKENKKPMASMWNPKVFNQDVGIRDKVQLERGLETKPREGCLYLFVEGYSNAVRKPVYMREFL